MICATGSSLRVWKADWPVPKAHKNTPPLNKRRKREVSARPPRVAGFFTSKVQSRHRGWRAADKARPPSPALFNHRGRAFCLYSVTTISSIIESAIRVRKGGGAMSMPIRLCPRGRHGFDQPFFQNSTHLRMEHIEIHLSQPIHTPLTASPEHTSSQENTHVSVSTSSRYAGPMGG